MKKLVQDYEKLISLKIKIPIYDGDIIQFSFKRENLPHLLGLNKLIDIEIFEKFKNKEVTARDIFKQMKNGTINMEFISQSTRFKEVFENKIKYFSSENILKTIKNSVVIKFNPNSIKCFNTKLDKVDYLFYEIVINEEGKYYHFGIGFSLQSNTENFPNTFFIRDNDDYVKNEQDKVFPTSIYIEDQDKKIYFKVYWSNIREQLVMSRKSYRKLKVIVLKYNLDLKKLSSNNLEEIGGVDEQDLNNLKSDFVKLRRDEVYEAYRSHIKFEKWNNQYKDCLVRACDLSNGMLIPREVAILLNEYHVK
ncbi:MAG: PBECR4 domain-containing protein [Sarcina sp.]